MTVVPVLPTENVRTLAVLTLQDTHLCILQDQHVNVVVAFEEFEI